MPLKKYTACVIPAKGGSVRVPNKNMQLIGKETLIERAAWKALEADCFTDVFIDTDSDEIWEAAKCPYAKRLVRPKNLSDGIHDLVRWELKDCGLEDYDIIFHLHCTAPLLSIDSIRLANQVMHSTDDDRLSVFTVRRIAPFFWKEQSGKYIPLYDINKMPRSQEITPLLEETHGLYGFRPTTFFRTGTRFGEIPVPILVSELEGYDIDTEQDLRVVRVLDEAIRRGDL